MVNVFFHASNFCNIDPQKASPSHVAEAIARLTRLQLHSGLFCNDVIPIDPTLPRKEILEQLAERAPEEKHWEEFSSVCVIKCVFFWFGGDMWKREVF